MFFWERFKNYSPQPIAFEAATMMTMEDENGVVRSVPDKARENEGSEVVQLEAT